VKPPFEQLRLSGVQRDGDEPSGHTVRMVSMLIALVRDTFVSFAWYSREFERSERQFARDLKHLRLIGETMGLKIGKQKAGVAPLETFAGNRLQQATREHQAMLHAIGRALGAPIAKELGIAARPEEADRFVVLALPTLVEGSAAAGAFATFKEAARNHARVRFRYGNNRADRESEVEPYRVLVRSGRYYLVGFDVSPRKGWRYFALDQIAGPITRLGTFKPRAVPQRYLDADAVGMFQSGEARAAVTVRLSPAIATSIASRRWQRVQEVVKRADGSADITLHVSDTGEAVRWALGLGAEAVVIAPPSAVETARAMVAQIDAAYRRTPAVGSPTRTAKAGA